jgi:ATP synthase protein I
LDTGIRRLLLYQLVLVAVTSFAFLVIFEIFSAASVWFGGGIAAMNVLLQARCASRDALRPERSPQQSLVAVYICVVQRFLVVALMFALGLGVFELDPLAVLAGFIAGQIILIVSGSKHLTQK